MQKEKNSTTLVKNMKDESLSVCLGLIPVATLVAGTVVGQRVAMPDEVVACLSNTSTGLMAAILCMDLMPEVINEARRRTDKAAIGVGSGVASLVLVGLYAATEYQQRALDASEQRPRLPRVRNTCAEHAAIHGLDQQQRRSCGVRARPLRATHGPRQPASVSADGRRGERRFSSPCLRWRAGAGG